VCISEWLYLLRIVKSTGDLHHGKNMDDKKKKLQPGKSWLEFSRK